MGKIAVLDTEKLQDYINQQNINASKLAANIGVSPACMSRVLNNKREPSGLVWSGLIGLMGKKVFDYIFFADNVSNDTNGGGANEPTTNF
jgi:hypothetical protein